MIEVAYHGTKSLAEVLRDGLLPDASRSSGCRHICLAKHSAVAANFGTVLRVDVKGLPVIWEKGEGRLHEGITRDRITPLGYKPDASWDDWEDPALRHTHIACLVRGAHRLWNLN